jgi:hypothetical protein
VGIFSLLVSRGKFEGIAGLGEISRHFRLESGHSNNANKFFKPAIASNSNTAIVLYDGRMREAPLPNFFIVGTGKAGTTSLYHYLRQHPQIFMSPVKEPCFFASEVRIDNLTPLHVRHIRRQSRKLSERLADGKPVRPMGWIVSEWEDYLRLFQNVQSETAIGEASVVYLWSETAAVNIASRLPDAKIIMMLRDPSERAFSQYLHQLTAGLTHRTFREHIGKCMRNQDRKISAYYPLLEVGLYHDQVKRYLDRFPRKDIRIYWYEEDWREPSRLLADIFAFLRVDPTFCPDLSHKSLQRSAPRFPGINRFLKQFDITHKAGQVMPDRVRLPIRNLLRRRGPALAMDSGDRRLLVDYYRDDVLKLASLLDHDLSAWL